ncbi:MULTISPECIES: methionyl-tRNA formyltransferase [unclassified Microbacterium]|uniref:methionyl-tRNA formyltransferase n=1 Tax=unclassified Microbacterium TaxID=2609290 RepID=UPI0012FC20A3|nr:methionyl-tRNA formyltransferase [Microbacterium sp. MAH-37]MVQ42544.1 methionyl-tRNA formyltransferase [Microbacterium sp. MAH-37]
MRLVFAGTPDAAVPTLRALAPLHDIVAVVTRPDAPLGRRRVLTPSPVAQVADELGIPVIKAARLDAEATDAITALRPELGVIVAFGGLVREPLLSAPGHGWINLHFSLLPRWRGAAPVQRALIAGDESLGVSVFRLVPELDAGDVYGMRPVSLPGTATAADALGILAEDGAALTVDVVAGIAAGTAQAVPQTGEPTFAPKLVLADGLLDWNRPLDEVYARFRGITPEPGAHTEVAGARLKVLEAAPATDAAPIEPGRIVGEKRRILIGTASAPLAVTRVQPAGKGAMPAADWWRGQRDETLRAGA